MLSCGESLVATQEGGDEEGVPEQQGRQQVVHHFLQLDFLEDVLPDVLTWDVS
jgi:hypothetical protein